MAIGAVQQALAAMVRLTHSGFMQRSQNEVTVRPAGWTAGLSLYNELLQDKHNFRFEDPVQSCTAVDQLDKDIFLLDLTGWRPGAPQADGRLTAE
ncbi:hypothetical protein BJX68DRAFT_128831 [Aspergillus pseudodeflectus]|uniref:Uncharacterized protein n=1 Tax=Aspergillus pseudodeflectus TaxID=176178 RepID=A0ABR4K0Z0_9EURO